MDQQRHVAHITNISTLLSGTYVKGEDVTPHHVKIGNTDISRVNLMGVIVTKNEGNIAIGKFEDGTGMIDLLFFEDITVPLGTLVRLVGRIREYEGNIAISPEIVKAVDNPIWRDVHQKQSLSVAAHVAEQEVSQSIQENPATEETVATEEVVEEPVASETSNKFDDVLNLIRKLDSGQGADQQEIVDTIESDDVIAHLLREGEIFEISPGKLKVLE